MPSVGEPAHRAPLEIGRQQQGEESDDGKGATDRDHQPVGVSAGFQLLRALRDQRFFEGLQPHGDGIRVARGGGFGFLPVAFDGQLGCVKLLL